MTESVLILGNGISRLCPSVQARIDGWRGKLWICNQAYLEFPHADLVAGHEWVLDKIVKAQIEGKPMPRILGNPKYGQELRTAPTGFRRDSGCTLIAEALERGYNVICAGFDLGGPDIYSRVHHLQPKAQWVTRIREILDWYGWDRVTWWGHDWRPFLQSDAPARSLSLRYRAGKPHVPGDEYDAVHRQWITRVDWDARARDRQMVKVKHTSEASGGYETWYNRKLATMMQEKGTVVIIVDPERKEAEVKEGYIRVRYQNGFETAHKPELARRLAFKGKVVIVEDEPVTTETLDDGQVSTMDDKPKVRRRRTKKEA